MKVMIVAAVTADGFIARKTEELADWTSSEDKKLFVKLTKEAGVMVMGSRTFDTIGRALPGRRNLVYTTRPEAYQTVADIELVTGRPNDLIERLEGEGVAALAVIGGAQIYDLFLRAGLVTDLYLTIEPRLFGRGVPILQDSLETLLKLVSVERLGSEAVALHYTIAKEAE